MRKRRCAAILKKNSEWTFAGIYADEGISGTSVDKRKEFMRLMRDCQKGKVDCISKKVLRNNGELTRYLISNNHPAITSLMYDMDFVPKKP